MKAAVFVLGSVLLAHPAGAQVPVYRCASDAGTVYSDRPCGANADPHEIDDSGVTVYTPPPPTEQRATMASAKPVKVRRAKAARLPDPAKQLAACAKLQQSLRDVRTKMRSGYSAKEGERLKTRQRELDQRRRLEKCR